MNVEVVFNCADRLEAAAALLDEISARTTNIVGSLCAAWGGPDAIQFQGWWESQHRPRLRDASEAVAGLGRSARFNARDQIQASGEWHGGAAIGASTAAVAGGTAAARAGRGGEVWERPTGRIEGDGGPAPAAMRDAVYGRADKVAQTAGKSMPGAIERLKAWQAELQGSDPTVLELQAFERYAEMIALGNQQRAAVTVAAEAAVAEYRAGGIAFFDAGSAVAFDAIKYEGEVGAVLDKGNLAHGEAARAIQSGASVQDAADLGRFIEGQAGAVGNDVVDLPGRAMEGAIGLAIPDSSSIVADYERLADEYLVSLEARARGLESASGLDPGFIRQGAAEELWRAREAIQVSGERADAFKWATGFGDGKILSSALSSGMNHLVPHSGTTAMATANGAESKYRLETAMAYHSLAISGSVDQLERASLAMSL